MDLSCQAFNRFASSSSLLLTLYLAKSYFEFHLNPLLVIIVLFHGSTLIQHSEIHQKIHFFIDTERSFYDDIEKGMLDFVKGNSLQPVQSVF